MIEVAIAESSRRAITISVWVVDAGGVPLALTRMDEAQPTRVEMAAATAWTAACHRRATHEVAPVAQPGKPGFGVHPQFGGRFSILPGVLAGA